MSTDQDENQEINPATQESGSEVEVQEENAGKQGGPLAFLCPPELTVWNEARKLVADKNIRVEDLATCCSQDPIIVIDLLKTSNAMYFSGGKSPITAVKTAIVRLGSDIVLETLDKMSERSQIESEEVAHWFEIHRSRCRRTSIIARILAEALARTLSDDCQAASLLQYVGEMLAVAHFAEKYVKLAEELSRTGINYRLAQDHKFDVERMGLAYLRRHGIPEALVFAIDRDARSRAQERAIMKPLCMAAGEMVDAFDTNRWEKLAPGKTIPVKSNLRVLQINDAQYLKIYERASEYLFSARLLEEKKKQQASEPAVGEGAVEDGSQADSDPSLHSEIEELLKASGEIDTNDWSEPELDTIPEEQEERPPSPKGYSLNEDSKDQFGLASGLSKPKAAARVLEKSPSPAKIEKPAVASETSKQMLDSVSDMLDQAKSSEELLTELLKMLVDSGPFEKSALIVVAKDRSKAVVVAARGPNVVNGQTIVIDDPLSPLAQCFSKIQSFGNKGNKLSPWGSKSFALAPIDADHDTPVALYADCGNERSVSFEARRIFRNVINALNEKLPQIPGGIPVEV